MPKRCIRLTLFLALLSPIDVLPAGPATEPPPAGVATLPVSELRAGMIATVTTALAGDDLTEIEVELLGTLPNGIGPGVDMILGRLKGEAGNWNGVAAGMSGSPVTYQGKLIGALSYSVGQFTKEPICGITPIGAMLDLENYPGGALPWREPTRSRVSAASIEPLPMALSVRGLSAALIERWPQMLQELGFDAPVTLFPAASSTPSTAQTATDRSVAATTRYAPGRAISALLVWGDVTVGATGTISWARGETLLAFGHPFLGDGRVTVPMAPAHIVWTVPSLANSFKIARIEEPTGTWDQDRLTAIRGTVGTVPRGVPVSLQLTMPGRPALNRQFHVVDSALLTPVMAAVAVRSTLLEFIGAETNSGLSADTTVRLVGGTELHYHVTASGVGGGAPDGVVALALAQRLGELTRAQVDLPPIEAVDVRVEAYEPDISWTLRRLLPDRLSVHRGESLDLALELEGPHGERRREHLRLSVPGSAPLGSATVLAGSALTLGGETGAAWEARRRTARSAADYLAATQAAPREDLLMAMLAVPAEGNIAEGRDYPALPSSVQQLLKSRVGGGELYRSRWNVLTTTTQPLGRLLLASSRVSIEVLP